MKNAFATIYLKRPCGQQKFFLNYKIFKYWIKKIFFSMLIKKKQFSGCEFDPKTKNCQ